MLGVEAANELYCILVFRKNLVTMATSNAL